MENFILAVMTGWYLISHQRLLVLETNEGAPQFNENLQMERDTKNLHVDVQIVEKSVPVNIAADMPETEFYKVGSYVAVK